MGSGSMDANERLHADWLGMAQPEGLVVTVAALKDAEANITSPIAEQQAALRELAGERKQIGNLQALFREVLEWSDEYLLAGEDIPATLRVALDGGELLAPDLAVRSADVDDAFVLLIQQTPREKLDAASDDTRWSATAHQRFERLLRDTGVGVGLLGNGRDFRLVYAPKGESAGHITFRLADMLTVDGRPLLGAFHMLLNQRRLLSLGEGKRLGDLLAASREYQSTVSTKLREQLLAALRDLLLGFQHADRLASGTILGDYRRDGGLQQVYLGLVTVLMRMVFVLFAEERGLLPMESELYASSYSLSRLYAQLQEDRNRHGDTLDDRYGAWGRVITLVRLLHDGVRAADGLFLPARKGTFFDPNAFPFLEGRPRGHERQKDETLDLPKMSDGVVFRVLDRLLLLDGERLQYKGLDVEQIGSVYEGLMGFEVEVAEGDSLCVMPEHVVVDLEGLLRAGGAERVKELKAKAGLDLKDKAAGEVKDAKTVEALVAALGKRVSARQPGVIPRGSLYLQPGEERRRTGSHYTPRKLTQPIVETTLRPVLERLGPQVTPEQILDLKICDPAMGSGAFLVEACRQLAAVLVNAWRRTGTMPELPPDEVPELHARRLIAQRCIYGVDKNPLAVDLARLSMWLVTFAKEHPFTFVDHSLRNGDSLVGLSKEQIASLALDVSRGKQIDMVRVLVAEKVQQAEELRREIHQIGDPPDNQKLDELWRGANEALSIVRMLGDLVVASYFSEDSDKARKTALENVSVKVQAWLGTGAFDAELRGMVAELHEGEKPLLPFHWEVEFPEVFGGAKAQDRKGFDCFVGNPPFAGKNMLFATSGETYVYFLVDSFEGAHGSGDLVAYFFRRAFDLLQDGGTLGLVATNTIAQGDTRAMGLQWIRAHEGWIYEAKKRMPWPGAAAVVVSVVHVSRKQLVAPVILDGRAVERITSYLAYGGSDAPPARLLHNRERSFLGSVVLGMGFTFDDDNPNASSIAEMHRIFRDSPASRERVFPYMGGEDVNTSPTLEPRRYVINFADMTEEEARHWPDLMAIVETKVRPERQKLGDNGDARRRKTLWWRWGQYAHALFSAIRGLSRVIVASRVSPHLAFAWQPTDRVFSDRLVVITAASDSAFCVLQSSVHEVWARFFSSTLEDRLNYAPSDCFETFPFPPEILATTPPSPLSPLTTALETIGETYYTHRAALMIANGEGLTKTYNRFHHPDDRTPGILRLRELHAAMDRAVLDAYGWTDIVPVYDFRPQLDESTRYTWAEETRDEVLARLLELNRVMAAKEAEEAAQAGGGKPAKKGAGKKRGKKDEATLELPMAKPAKEGGRG
jgi:hypothetical protein